MSYAIKRNKMRGDPGFWSSAAGLVKKGFEFGQQAGVIPSFNQPSPMVLPPGPQVSINPPLGGPPGMDIAVGMPGGWELGLGISPEEVGQVGQMIAPGRNGNVAPSGYHWNKSGYFLKSGQFVAPGTKLVKNRRRNPLNPRALDRAMGRISSAKNASKKLSRVTIRKTCSHR